MHVGIPVARYHPGTTAEYVQRALAALGHRATVLTPAEFARALPGTAFDYFLCVDSSDALPLDDPAFAERSFARVAVWFIDFRHNRDRATRRPTDLENARVVAARGGRIFQAQYEDVEACRALGLGGVSWLPLAADPEVWSDAPATPKEFHIGFVGNVYDAERRRALEILGGTTGLRLGLGGAGAVWKEDAAALLRRSMVGFNINSFFGEPIAYDVNMRVFETLSCGVPLLTNDVPGLTRLLPGGAPFVRTYTSLADLRPTLLDALADRHFLAAGTAARAWVVGQATYEHRMQQVLECARAGH